MENGMGLGVALIAFTPLDIAIFTNIMGFVNTADFKVKREL